jgi:ABC-2 type transport system permease protein
MLWFKAWRESRARFVLSASVIAGLCLVLLLWEAELRRRAIATPSLTYASYVYSRVYAGVIRVIFLVLAVILGLGGLHRERAHGTLGFTLALPVPRVHHLLVRAAVGVLEIGALAALPVILVPVCSTLVGEHYAWAQAIEFGLLWVAVGALVFAAGLLVSVVVRNDYAALAVSIVVLRLVPPLVARTPGLHDLPLQFNDLMSGRGMSYFDPRTDLLVGDVPWLVVAGIACAAAALVAVAAALAARERIS